MIQGLLTEVVEEVRGSHATATAAVGATQLTLDDVANFPETGGTIDVLGVRLDYTLAETVEGPLITDADTSSPADDTTGEVADVEPDPASNLNGLPDSSGTLTLAAPLEVQVDEDDPVLLVMGNETATDAYALVDLPIGDGDAPDQGGDTLKIPIAYDQRAMFPVGPYDPPVAVELADDLSAVLTVPGVRPVVDGSTIINLPPPAEPTEPPASSPAVEVHGTADSLVVEVADDYAGTTTLDFHISTEPEFEPTATTLAGSSRSAVFVITDIGVAGEGGVITRERLQLGVTYHVRAVAHNVVGPAAPGPVTSGSLDPSVVSEVIAARLVAGFILAGAIQAGNITISPESGIVIPLSNGGVITFPADGSPATIDAYVHARALNVEGDLSINGYGEVGGDMMFTAGVTTPSQPPAITWGWPSVLPPSTSGTRIVGPGSTVTSVTTQKQNSAGSELTDTDFRTGTVSNVRQLWMPTNYPEHPKTWAAHRVLTYTKTNYSGGPVAIATQGPPPGTIPPESGPWGYSPVNWLWMLNAAQDTILGYLVVPDPGPEQATTQYMDDMVVVDLIDNGATYGLRYSRYEWQTATNTWLATTSNEVLPSWSTTEDHPDLEVVMFRAPAQSDAAHYLGVYSPKVGGPIRVFERSGLGSSTPWLRVTARDMVVPNGMGPVNGLAACDLNLNGSLSQARVIGRDANKTIYRFSTMPLTQRTVNARYTWYDGDAGNGTHESLPSSQVSALVPPGQWPVITAPPAPHVQITDPDRVDKADRHGIYVSTTPNSVRRFGYLARGINGIAAGELDPGFDRTANTSSDMGLPATEPLVPTTDGFIGTTTDPANLYSQTADALGPLWKLTGNGTWRLGSLTGLASGAVNGAGRVQAGVSTYRATPSSSAPGAILGQEATPTVWSSSILRGFTYSAGAWTCQPGAGGTYLVWAKATWAADTVNDWGCGLQVWKNGAQMGGINDITLHSKTLGNSTGPVLLATIEIAVGDQMALSIWQASGTARTPNGVQFYLAPLLS